MNLKSSDLLKKMNRLKELCYLTEESPNLNPSSVFNPPAREEEIVEWERANGMIIPESYKEWLRFSNGSVILQESSKFLGLSNFIVGGDFVPKDMVYIGYTHSFLNTLCFSTVSGKMVMVKDGETRELDDMEEAIDHLIELAMEKASQLDIEIGDEEDDQSNVMRNAETLQRNVVNESATKKMIELLETMKKSPEGLTEQQEKFLAKYKAETCSNGGESK